MKLKAAVAISVALHISLFAIALYVPGKVNRNAPTTYYVDLFSMPGNGSGGGGGKGTPPPPTETQRMKDLTAKKEEPESQLRYPDENVKKSKKKKDEPKKKEMITIVKNETKQKPKESNLVTGANNLPVNVLKTGISSSGSGGGTGGGYGSGSGGKFGSGSGLGGFPYAYYIEMIRSRISSSWYNALVSPGVRGRYVASVFFKILRNGQTRDLALEGKSGNDALDLSALRAIENASPFPPLPGDYLDSSLIVHFEFEWEKK